MAGGAWRVVAGSIMVVTCGAAGAQEPGAAFGSSYLVGKWTTGSTEKCTAAEHERTLFRADGTFITESRDKAVAVGFWQAPDEDRLVLHVLGAPHGDDEGIDATGADYTYLPLDGLVFDVTPDSFRVVLRFPEDLKGLDVVRCP
jgi:hypothetical protein